jgi:hypothetical protein
VETRTRRYHASRRARSTASRARIPASCPSGSPGKLTRTLTAVDSSVSTLDASAAVRASEAKQWTQHEAAAAIGWAWRKYGRIERGEIDMRLSTLIRVARGLGIEPAELLRDVE